MCLIGVNAHKIAIKITPHFDFKKNLNLNATKKKSELNTVEENGGESN